MISSFHVKQLMSLQVQDLQTALERGGYTDVFVDRCYFSGITDSNKFCYEVFFRDDYSVVGSTKVYVSFGDDFGVVGSTKVYVSHDSTKGCAVAEF